MTSDEAVPSPDWESLQRVIAGEVAEPGSPAYERLPHTFNARYHDVAPRAVVLCAAPEDVAETLSFVAAHGLELALRSGGHCFAGRSSSRGVVVDVSRMTSVSVDGGVATIGAGARLGDVYDALQPHGLAVPGGTCPPVGIAGLALGGGLGVLGRAHGVLSDHLAGARVVLADGRIVDCDEHHHSDLFWALRGAGAGNFGVVTSFVFDTVPAPEITNVRLSWPFRHAARIVDAWQHWAPVGPDELAASLKVTASGDIDEPPAVAVYAAVQGSEADATELTNQLVGRVGVDPATASQRLMSFPESRRFWAALGATDDLSADVPEPAPGEPVQLFAKSEYFHAPMPMDAIAALLAGFVEARVAGEERELDFMPWGGAYNRVPAEATAFVHRDELFQLKHAAVVEPSAPRPRLTAAHEWVARSWESVHPLASGRVFQNFADPDLDGWADAYYGSNYERLVRIKSRYDPGNRFRFHQSIPTA